VVRVFWISGVNLSVDFGVLSADGFPRRYSFSLSRKILCQFGEKEKPGDWEEAVSGRGQVGWVRLPSWGDERQIQLHCLEGMSAFRALLSPLGSFAVGARRPWFICREFLSRLPGLGRERHLREGNTPPSATCVFSISLSLSLSLSLFVSQPLDCWDFKAYMIFKGHLRMRLIHYCPKEIVKAFAFISNKCFWNVYRSILKKLGLSND